MKLQPQRITADNVSHISIHCVMKRSSEESFWLFEFTNELSLQLKADAEECKTGAEKDKAIPSNEKSHIEVFGVTFQRDWHWESMFKTYGPDL